jgi:hypothetical protein
MMKTVAVRRLRFDALPRSSAADNAQRTATLEKLIQRSRGKTYRSFMGTFQVGSFRSLLSIITLFATNTHSCIPSSVALHVLRGHQLTLYALHSVPSFIALPY